MATEINYDDIIILRSANGPVGTVHYIYPCPDEFGQYPQHIRERNSSGQLILSDSDKEEQSKGKIFLAKSDYIKVTSGMTFDLRNPVDKAKWEAIKNAPVIALNRYEKDKKGRNLIDGDPITNNYSQAIKARYGKAELFVERPHQETTSKISKKRLRHEAEAHIYSHEISVLKKVCKILGRDMSNFADVDVQDFLLDYAIQKPQIIIDLFTGSDLNLHLIFIDALDKEVINFQDGLFFYKNVVLGASKDAVVEYFKNASNIKVVESIKSEILPYAMKANEKTQEHLAVASNNNKLKGTK